jgi:Ligand-binding domain of nuclear hormone receptor
VLFSGWNELLIAGFSHRSTCVLDAVLLATGLQVTRNRADEAGIGAIFDRVQVELVNKMRDMKMDKTELGCLRAIVLYNPGKSFMLYYTDRLQVCHIVVIMSGSRYGHCRLPGNPSECSQ